jgi:outer membrane protein OmpA-like peptidoglycan-associated protein
MNYAMLKFFFNITFIVIITLSLSSCAVNQGAVESSKTALKTSIETNERSLKMLAMMSEQSDKAYKEGKIAESANNEIQSYVINEKFYINTQNQQMEKSLKELSSFGVTEENLKKANKVVDDNNRKLRILEEKTKVIVDFLGNETFSKSEIGALFNSGEYKLLAEQLSEGERLFKPIVEKLFDFASRYKGTFSKLKGEIIVTGYSDATPIDRNSKLFRDLANQIGVSEPNSSLLNQKLSELRASAVKELLEKIINDKKVSSNQNLEISITVLGKGEEIPRGLPNNITKNDFRRRVVTFYWVVLPKL